MSALSLVNRLASTDSKWYLLLGGLSLLKAIGVRHNRRRLRRELLDAGMFFALGLLLRQVERRTSRTGERGSPLDRLLQGRSTDDLESMLDRMMGDTAQTEEESLFERVKRRTSSDEPERSPAETLRRRLSGS